MQLAGSLQVARHADIVIEAELSSCMHFVSAAASLAVPPPLPSALCRVWDAQAGAYGVAPEAHYTYSDIHPGILS
jgi:hypothetical protein